MIIKEELPEGETPEEEVNVYTCYVTPCPEEQNLHYQPPELMICYRSPSDDGSNPGKVKYYCSPIEIIRSTSGEKNVFQFRIKPNENKQENNLPNQSKTSDSENPFFTTTYFRGQQYFCTTIPNQFCPYQQMYTCNCTPFQRPYCSNFNPNYTYNNVADARENDPRNVQTGTPETATK